MKSNILITVICTVYNYEKFISNTLNGFSPFELEAGYWGNFEFFDVAYSVIAKPGNMLYYLLHFKSFLTDSKLPDWKIEFLYRLLSLPLHYSNIISFTQRIYYFLINEV